MRVLIIIRSLDSGGSERQVVELAKGLVKRAVEVHIGVFYSGGRLEAEVANIEGIVLHDLRKVGRWHIRSLIKRLNWLIDYYKYDLVYGFLSTGNLLSLICKRAPNRPKIFWGIRDSGKDFSAYDYLVKVISVMEVILARFADKIIVNSFAGLEKYIEMGFPSNKMVVITNAINTREYRFDPVLRVDIRRNFGFSNNNFLIGNIARLHPKKGHKTFLRAAKLLMDEREDVRFFCIGGYNARYKGYADEIKRYSSDLGLEDVLYWLGDCNNIPAFLSSLDLFCSTSLFGEGFPNVLAEAMACGVPCVATDCGDSKIIVGNLFRTVSVKDHEGLFREWKAILELPHEQRRQMGVLARDRIERKFSIDRMVDETLLLLKSI